MLLQCWGKVLDYWVLRVRGGWGLSFGGSGGIAMHAPPSRIKPAPCTFHLPRRVPRGATGQAAGPHNYRCQHLICLAAS